MPRVWANDGSEVVLIHKQLMEQTAQQFDEECQIKFQRHPPLCIQSDEHNGFVHMTRHDKHSFSDYPAELWNSEMLEVIDLKRLHGKKRIDPVELANAKAWATQETGEPNPAIQP